MNTGKPLHRRSVETIATGWRAVTSQVFVEHALRQDGLRSYVDVFVVVNCYRIAIEVELSTRYVQVNAAKALQLGCDEIHLVFPTARLRDAAKRKLRSLFSHTERKRIAFLLISAYQPRSYVTDRAFPVGKCPLEKTKKTENESLEGPSCTS